MSTPKWYKKTWAIVLLIIVFFPIGLVLMWRHASWSTTTKAVITGLFALALVSSPDRDDEGLGIDQKATDQLDSEAEEDVETDSNDASDQTLLKAEQAKQDSIAEVQKEQEKKKCIADAEDFYRELQGMHTELQSFRKTKDFKFYGFGRGGDYYSWLERIGKMKDDPRNRCCLIHKNCLAGELEMLGMEYASEEGRDTDYTIQTSMLFSDGESQSSNVAPKSTSTSRPQVTKASTSQEWYEGGTLHKATIARWKTSTERNKLATCGDFMAAYDKSVSMSELLAGAVALKSCIDVATDGLDYTNSLEVSTMAALCIQELDY
jgi:hypothetical protein